MDSEEQRTPAQEADEGFKNQREIHPDNPDGTFDNLDAVIPPHTPDSLTVVGIGGSAGAIPALREFFSFMPTDSGIAFVVVLHLAADRDSALPEVLQMTTSMPVRTVNEIVPLEANHIYVIPPNVHLGLSDGEILPQPLQQPRGKRVAVDLFFRALADTHGSKAVGIVLSGADGDGAIGLKRIKERGGLTIAQDPVQAQYPCMPREAIATGMVDWILPVQQMAIRLVAHQQNEKALRLPPEATVLHQNEEQRQAANRKEIKRNDETALREVLSLLQTRTGHDFSSYKRATVLRRIGRRLQVNGLPDLPRYLDFLRTVPAEAGALLSDLLINVTNFFRDTEAFNALQEVVPRLFKDKKSGDTVRVWVAGCATGEEAYSVAMLLHEYADNLDEPPKIVVFATDISEEAIMRAREACYPETIQADVSPKRLRRFFTLDTNCYRVKKEVRESVLFAAHNLLKDAPFSRLDLVTCRNLLIYLGRDAQQRAFEIFHFALRPEGILFLGTSESADDTGRLFTSLDKKYRLYIRRAPAHSATPSFPFPTLHRPASTVPMTSVRPSAGEPTGSPVNEGTSIEASRRGATFGELHLRLLERYASPSILVSDDYEILHLSESAGHYLQFTGGEPTNNLLKLVRPSLRLELSTALFSAGQTGKDVQVTNVPLQVQSDVTKYVTLNIRPVQNDMRGERTLMLVLFEETGEVTERPALPLDDPIARRLDAEVQHLKSQLRATIEQYEASSEELKASNEELQAMNEEARSTTEELETSKEELQSVNEELITVNQELKSNIEELARSNSDLQNLITSTDIPTIFLDRELRIKRYTPRAMEIFNIIPSDIARPLAHLTHTLEYAEMVEDAESVLDNLVGVEREVSMRGKRWFLSHMLPYRTADNSIDGVVLTLVDITSRKQSEEALRESEERYRTLFESVDEGFAIVEMIYDKDSRAIDYRMLETNPAFEKLLGSKNPKGKTARELNPDLGEEWIEILAAVAETGKSVRFEKYMPTLDNWFDVSATRPGNPEERRVVTVFTNTTQRKRAEEAMRESEERFRLLVEGTRDYAMFLMDTERRIVHWNAGAERIFGWTREDAIGQSGDIIFTPEDVAAGEQLKEMQIAVTEGRAIDRRWHLRKDGSRFWADGVMTCLNHGDALYGFAKVARDATADRQASEALQLAHERLQRAHDESESRVAERTAQFRELNEALQLEVLRRQELEQARELLLQRIVTTQEEERRRISRELHDQTGQQLTALLMGLKTLPDTLSSPATTSNPSQGTESRTVELSELTAHLQPLQKVTEELMEHVHKLAWELRPATIDNLGLEAALKLHAQEWAKHSGVEPDFISRGFARAKRLPPPVETTLYRVVQEALTNVQRHANAQHVSILLERVGDEVLAVIEDDGLGFKLANKRKTRASAKSHRNSVTNSSSATETPDSISGRLGLLGMRERVELIGGALTIESKPGKGTSVYARVPVERRKEPRDGNDALALPKQSKV